MTYEMFTDPILTRALSALAIIAAGLAFYWLINRVILLRAERNGASATAEIPGARPGTAAILYFTTPDCAPCRTIQRPALQTLQDRLGDALQVIEINAQDRPDLAGRWGVLSVPTTFIIAADGKLKHVNHGATRADRLMEQVQGV